MAQEFFKKLGISSAGVCITFAQQSIILVLKWNLPCMLKQVFGDFFWPETTHWNMILKCTSYCIKNQLMLPMKITIVVYVSLEK